MLLDEIDLITYIIQRTIESLAVLNSYKVGGFGLMEILIIFLLISVIVPILLRMAGYTNEED